MGVAMYFVNFPHYALRKDFVALIRLTKPNHHSNKVCNKDTDKYTLIARVYLVSIYNCLFDYIISFLGFRFLNGLTSFSQTFPYDSITQGFEHGIESSFGCKKISLCGTRSHFCRFL